MDNPKYIQVMRQVASDFDGTIPDFPPRPAWDDLCVLAREDDISAEVRGQELAVSWP